MSGLSFLREQRREHVGEHGDSDAGRGGHAGCGRAGGAPRARSSRTRSVSWALLGLVVALVAGCLPAPPAFLPRLSSRAPQPQAATAARPAAAAAPQPASPAASLAVAADVGGGYVGDFDPRFELASRAGLQVSAGIGWRRGARTILLRARLDYAGQELTGIQAAALGASFTTWYTIPVVHIPVEGEVGAGAGAFGRMGEAPHCGLDIFCSFGVPLRRERDLMLTLRTTNIHSTTNLLSAMLPPFGDQQMATFTLALGWRR